MNETKLNTIIDEILTRLFNDEDNKIEFSILSLQIAESLKVDIAEKSFKKLIFDTLRGSYLCEINPKYHNDYDLKLTSKGNEIIFGHKTYTNYLKVTAQKRTQKKILWVISTLLAPILTGYCIVLLQSNIHNNQIQNKQEQYENKMLQDMQVPLDSLTHKEHLIDSCLNKQKLNALRDTIIK